METARLSAANAEVVEAVLSFEDGSDQLGWMSTKAKTGSGLPGVSLACGDGEIVHILLGWKGTNELFIVRTRRIIGLVEIEDHLVGGFDLGFDVPPTLIGVSPIRLILEGDKQRIAQNRLVHFDRMPLPVKTEMEPAVPDVALIRSLVGQERGVVFRVVYVQRIPFDFPCEYIQRIKRVVVKMAELFLLLRGQGRTLVGFEELIPFLPPPNDFFLPLAEELRIGLLPEGGAAHHEAEKKKGNNELGGSAFFHR